MGKENQVKDLMMWVGSGPYPTWRGFADEAHAMGVCKRVRAVPRGIVVGQSKCYLLHGERVQTLVESTAHGFQKFGLTCRYCGIGFESNSQNLAPCRVHKLRRTGKPRRAMYGYFVIEEIVKVPQDIGHVAPTRLCGSLVPGGIYLRGPLTEYPEPKPWSENTFVGFRYWVGDA